MSYRMIARLALMAALGSALAACQTQKEITRTRAPEPNAIRAAASGFSPTGNPDTRTVRLDLYFGNKDLPQIWSVDIMRGSVEVQRFEGSGSGADLPNQVEWDGRTADGAVWPEGEYFAMLNVKYDGAYYPGDVAWDKFELVSSPPSVVLSADPPSFTPEGQGMAEPVLLKIESKSALAKVADWSIAVRDPGGAIVMSFSGAQGQGEATWDGSIEPQGYAEPAATYRADAEVRDEYGNVGRSSLPIMVRQQVSPPEASLVETEGRGFSPTSEKNGGAIELSLKIGNPEAMRSWKVDISDSGIIRRTFEGDAASAPASLAWDGRDNEGNLSPEGSYSASLTVDYGRTYKAARARTKDFVLSVAPPDCRLSATPESFVPSDKGVASPVAILLGASPHLGAIDSWSLDILDGQGRTVRSFSQKWPANQVLWDGTTSTGGLVETGASYIAKAAIVDEYGNRAESSVAIGVKDIPPASEPSLAEPRSSGFSPVGQGKPRSMDFILVAGNAAQMKSWKLAIAQSERGTQRVFSGSASAFKRNLSWDGKTDGGSLAPDGNYFATLTIDYGKSFKPASVRSAAFGLQAAPPDVGLELSPARLTPQAGTFQAPVSIALGAKARFAEIESWIVTILDPNGKTVALYKDSTPGSRFSWNGWTNAGAPAEPSMTYSVLAEVKDSYGNTGLAKALIPVDDLPPAPGQSAVLPSSSGFSPNGDATMDSIDLALTIPNKDAVKSWKVVIRQADSNSVQRTFSGDGSSIPNSLTWAGRGDSGSPTPAGLYQADMTIDYGAVYKAVEASSKIFVLDSLPPKASISVTPDLVVPDEHGLVAPAAILLDGSSALARMASWKVSISDASGKPFGTYEGPWPPNRLAWNGVAADGSLAESNAKYTVTAIVRDEFGLSGQVSTSISTDALPQATEPSGVAALSKGFSPAVKGSARFVLSFGNRNLIKGWNLDIERDDRAVRMRFPGVPGSLPETFSWNGLLQDGTIAPDGLYKATLSIDYGRVYAPMAVSSEAFALVASPPTGRLAIDPQLFSPDGSGAADKVTISLEADARFAKINDWSVSVLDPGGNPFASFSGQWPAKAISWNGKNAKGELVESAEDYPVIARIRDEYGNALELKSALRVDILIVKMGDGYRIRIASIVFKPFTADFLAVAPDIAERNVATLNLLAEKLKKFPGYQIRMVGHAVMVNWDNPALGKKEQEKELIPLSRDRAAAIMKALEARGIESARMVTDGVGASDQIVPDSDFANRWKNRRVEFFLRRSGK